MLQTLRQWPIRGSFTLSPEFCKDLVWFGDYLPTIDGVYIIHQDGREPVHLYVDACESGCGAITSAHAYHARFPTSVQSQNHLICHLGALNSAVALMLWARLFSHQLVHLFSDNMASVGIFQAGQGRDPFLHQCARDIWLTYAKWDISLAIGHVPGDQLKDTTNTLSCWHLGSVYRDRFAKLVSVGDITMYQVPDDAFILSNDI